MAEEAVAEEPMVKDTDVSIYGRFWPRVTYSDVDGGDSSTDITDALSRVGIKANTQITETLSPRCCMESGMSILKRTAILATRVRLTWVYEARTWVC